MKRDYPVGVSDVSPLSVSPVTVAFLEAARGGHAERGDRREQVSAPHIT